MIIPIADGFPLGNIPAGSSSSPLPGLEPHISAPGWLGASRACRRCLFLGSLPSFPTLFLQLRAQSMCLPCASLPFLSLV